MRACCDHRSVEEIVLCDENGFGFGWIERRGIRRTAHALAHNGRVWLLDPFEWEGLDARIDALGEPAGVVQLLDRHRRDCVAIAGRLGVPLRVVPVAREEGLPFVPIPLVRGRLWRESALWWPAERTLVCADALGSAGYFRAS